MTNQGLSLNSSIGTAALRELVEYNLGLITDAEEVKIEENKGLR